MDWAWSHKTEAPGVRWALFVDQAAMSGEAMPVEKAAQVDGVGGCYLLSFPNICLSRTPPHKGKLATRSAAVLKERGGGAILIRLAYRDCRRRRLSAAVVSKLTVSPRARLIERVRSTLSNEGAPRVRLQSLASFFAHGRQCEAENGSSFFRLRSSP